jgi:SAM-dependent methyltransferase
MVYSYYQGNTLPTSKETINKILMGHVFQDYGIENFLIEDFFSWIAKDEVNKEGIKVAYKIIDGLGRYDLTVLTEDVFRELYQQLVDPTERHDLGEYYTPEWLAERIVREAVKDTNSRVLDPACGSGTFLAATIRYKLSTMPDDMNPTEKLKSIVHTVYGIDVHPLAVLISKANFLMGLGNLLGKKDESIVIPVYMADSIIFPVPTRSISTFADTQDYVYIYRVEEDSNTELILPLSLVEAESADSIIDNITEFANRKFLFQISLQRDSRSFWGRGMGLLQTNSK